MENNNTQAAGIAALGEKLLRLLRRTVTTSPNEDCCRTYWGAEANVAVDFGAIGDTRLGGECPAGQMSGAWQPA